MAEPTAEELFEEARRIQPFWNDDGPDVAEREARSLELFRAAAKAGHVGAIEALADGLDGENALDWAIALARAGEPRGLVSAITSQDYSVERTRAVLAEAEAGQPWAQLAVGLVYELGSRGSDGKYVMSKPDGYRFFPAAKDPYAVGREWKERAAAAGWAAAQLSLAYADRRDDPARALAHLRAALADGGVLTPKQREHAGKVLPELLEATGASPEETLKARELVAKGGDPESMAWLGNYYRDAGDIDTAREWYERGVAKSDVDALRELGRMYEEGRGVAVDENRARELYEQAAELGADPFARDRLAEKFGLTWYARKKKSSKAGAQKAAGAKKAAAAKKTAAANKKSASATKPATKTSAAATKPAKTSAAATKRARKKSAATKKSAPSSQTRGRPTKKKSAPKKRR